jgi:ABC-type uncharacterized transport system permease subunit
MLPTIGTALSSLAGIGSLVCFIIVLVQIFKSGRTGLGIVCIVTFVFCCGIGGLIAFVVGWANHREWKITTVMIVWSVCVGLSFLGYGLSPFDPRAFSNLPGR